VEVVAGGVSGARRRLSPPPSPEEAAVLEAQAREARGRQLETELAWLERVRRRDLSVMFALVLLSLAVGLFLMASAVRVTSVELGMRLFYAGLGLGNLGVIGAIGWGLWRSVERGDAEW
jgi:hypothetical protein